MNILPESQFLIACCHNELSSNTQRLDERAREVNCWGSVVDYAAANGISSLVLGHLKALHERGIVPEDAVSRLRSVSVGETVKVIMLRNALRHILEALQQIEAQIIVLKGATLSPLYDETCVRPSQDVDLLCKEEDYTRIQDALLVLGYSTDDDALLPERHSHNETYFERHFLSADGLIHIELHIDSIKLGVRPRHTDSIWSRAVPIDIEGFPALSLCPEDQIMTLSVHLHRHGFNRLIWFKDIDLLLRRFGDEISWDDIVAEAKAEGAQSSLWYTMRILKKMLGTPVPDSVLKKLAPTRFTKWMLGRMWPESDVLNLNGHTKRRAVQFSTSESWRGMIPSLIIMGRRREKLTIMFRRLLSS